MIPWLDESDIQFPPIEFALDEPNGLLCAGGDLSIHTLLQAYSSGIFPWYSDPDPILWWSPSPRSIIKPNEIHISKSMKKLLKKRPFSISCDKAFIDVMHYCAEPRNYTDETWITEDMVNAYCKLHNAGYAHSIEVWQEEELVGGLYGVALGCVFFGESMFSNISNASKIGFIQLSQALEYCGFELIDCQVSSAHLDSLGAHEVDRTEFKSLLKALINKKPNGSPWDMLNT